MISNKRKYEITSNKENILKKTGTDMCYCGTICERELEKNKEHKWKINIIKTKRKLIYIGVAPFNFDFESPSISNGWYFKCCNRNLFSGPPQNYSNKTINLKDPFEQIIVIIHMSKGTLKFIIDNEDKGISFTDIPLDKPLHPALILHDKDDSVEIDEC